MDDEIMERARAVVHARCEWSTEAWLDTQRAHTEQEAAIDRLVTLAQTWGADDVIGRVRAAAHRKQQMEVGDLREVHKETQAAYQAAVQAIQQEPER